MRIYAAKKEEAVDGKVGLETEHDYYILFDKKSGLNIAAGSLCVITGMGR